MTLGGLLEYEKAFTYDDVGNRLTQTTNGSGAPGTPTAPGTITYGYDDRDRLRTETGIAGGYIYDDNGNLVTKDAEATYTWDFENRLIRVEKTNGTVIEHAYDVDGNRVQTKTTLPGQQTTTVNYLVDTSGSLSHVVAETDGAGVLKAYYVRGDDLLAVMRPLVAAPTTAADWQTRFYHADGLGSIRKLTNESGAVTDSYTTTAFGELLNHAGTDSQPYLFAGEAYDPNVGFAYHRARWLDPSTGRFAGIDPFEGRLYEPVTLHRYLYAAADPVNRTDPSGEDWSLATLGVTIGISLIIQGITSPVLAQARNQATRAARALKLAAVVQYAETAVMTRDIRYASNYYAEFSYKCNVLVGDAYTKGAGYANYPQYSRGNYFQSEALFAYAHSKVTSFFDKATKDEAEPGCVVVWDVPAGETYGHSSILIKGDVIAYAAGSATRTVGRRTYEGVPEYGSIADITRYKGAPRFLCPK